MAVRAFPQQNSPCSFRSFVRLAARPGGTYPWAVVWDFLTLCKRLVEAMGGEIWVRVLARQGREVACPCPTCSPSCLRTRWYEGTAPSAAVCTHLKALASSEIVFPSSSTSLTHQGFFNTLAQIPMPGSNPLKSGQIIDQKIPYSRKPQAQEKHSIKTGL